MNIKSIFAFLSLFILTAFSGGCVAVVAGGAAAGGTAYVMGDLQAQVESSAQNLQLAIVKAGDDLNLRRISGEADLLTGKYIFRTGTDQKVTIKYEVVTDNISKMSIRVGTFGDESISQRIYQAINRNL